jgi:uncharacterized membrane protein (UPF0136 family)
MAWLKYVVLLYAILNIGGGIEGYVAAKSVPSIISGCVAGALLFLGLYLTTTNIKLGFGICAIIAVGDLGFFTSRLVKGGGIWPAGVMVAASVITLGCLVTGHFIYNAPAGANIEKGA